MKDGELINTPIDVLATNNTGCEPSSLDDSIHWSSPTFDMRADGLYCEHRGEWLKVSSPFWADSRTREFDGSNHGIRIGWLDEDGKQHETNILVKETVSASKLAARLGDHGLRIEYGQERHFARALRSIRPGKAARVVSRIGWHADQVFVMPSRTIGTYDEPVLLAAGVIDDDPFSERGTLEDWKDGPASMARGNSRLMFAVSVALSGPMLEPEKAENTTFHIYGSSSIGKTSAARLAATVWGAPRFVDGFMKTWKTTSNGFELTAKSRCDTCLILDEINMADHREVAATAYQLSSGTGKTRMTSDLAMASMAKWRITALSTGEYSFQQYLGIGGVKITGGQSVRFASVPADAGKQMGILEDIHGRPSPGKFVDDLHVSCDALYGTAGPAFVVQIAARADRFAPEHQRYAAAFTKEYLPPGADGQVQRVCMMFGRIAATSAIASTSGIVPWTIDEGMASVGTCFLAWLDGRGHIGSHEVVEGIRTLRDAILRREPQDIAIWGADRVGAKLGYRRMTPPDVEGIYLNPWAVKAILRDHDVNAVIAELKRQGHVTADRGRNHRLARHPVTGRPTRFLCLSPLFLADADEPPEVPGSSQ